MRFGLGRKRVSKPAHLAANWIPSVRFGRGPREERFAREEKEEQTSRAFSIRFQGHSVQDPARRSKGGCGSKGYALPADTIPNTKSYYFVITARLGCVAHNIYVYMYRSIFIINK